MKSCLHQPPRLRAGLLAILSVFPVAGFAAVAGQFQFVAGDVRVQGVDGHQRPAQKGQEINEGETVVSAAGGSAQLRMIDGGILALRPESQLKIAEYRFKGREDGSEKASMSLVKGGLRAISGLIGKTNKQNYAITTPTATIGIRGTDHEPVVVLPPPPGTQLPHQPGTYDKVNTGIVALSKEGGLVLVNPNQVGFAGFGSTPPVLLPATPSFYRVTPLPTVMRSQQPPSSSGSENSSNNSSNASNSSNATSNTSNASTSESRSSSGTATTSSASGDGEGNAMRIGGQVDAGATTTSSTGTGNVNGTTGAGTTAPSAAGSSTLSGADSSGNKLDATQGVVKTPTGEEVLISQVVTQSTMADLGPNRSTVAAPAYVADFEAPPLYATPTMSAAAVSAEQTSLSSAGAQVSSAASAAGSALNAINTANGALLTAQGSLKTSGLSTTDLLYGTLSNALAQAQAALTDLRNAYDGGGSGAAGSTGVAKVVELARQAVASGNALVWAQQSFMSSATFSAARSMELARQSAQYSASSLAYSDGPLAYSTASNALNSANNNISNALSTAASAQSTNLTVQAAVQAVNDAITQAGLAAQALQTALSSVNDYQSAGSSLASYAGGQSYYATYRYPAVVASFGPGTTLTRDSSGNLIKAETNADQYYYSSSRVLSQTGSELKDLGSDPATGLSWGRWKGGVVSLSMSGGPAYLTSSLGDASLHWIAGSQAFPDYLPRVLTGNANYTLVGGTRPTDSFGNVGNLRSASLAVNFSAQLANAAVSFDMGNDVWGLEAANMLLNRGGTFSAFNCSVTSATCVSSLVVKKNAAISESTGGLWGSLLGNGLNAAALSYQVTEQVTTSATDSITGQTFSVTAPNIMTGVAALAGPTQDVTTAYRAVGAFSGGIFGLNSGYGSSLGYLGMSSRGAVSAEESADAMVKTDSQGALTQFMGAASYQPVSAGTTSDTVMPAGLLPYADAAQIRNGTSVPTKEGSLTLGGGLTIDWGRWAGGSIDIYNRAGTEKLGTVDNTSQSMHWVATSALTGPMTSLPLSGVANYTVVGGTSPSDLNGNLGTLGSATMKADFGALRADASVTVTMAGATNSNTYTQSVTGMVIGGNGNFGSATFNTMNSSLGIDHKASCSCGAPTQGSINGSFVGGGAPAAVMSYSFVTGTGASSSPALTATNTTITQVPNVVTGIAVLKR